VVFAPPSPLGSPYRASFGRTLRASAPLSLHQTQGSSYDEEFVKLGIQYHSGYYGVDPDTIVGYVKRAEDPRREPHGSWSARRPSIRTRSEKTSRHLRNASSSPEVLDARQWRTDVRIPRALQAWTICENYIDKKKHACSVARY
jgi:hypothetical protein